MNKKSNKRLNKTEESIMTGLQEAMQYANKRLKAKKHEVVVPIVDIHRIRDKIGLTQKQFALTFGVSISTIKNWEQGRRVPRGAARVLLKVIQKEPGVVERVLRSA